MKKFLTICALVAALAVSGCSKKKDNSVSEKYSNQTPATQPADPVESPSPIPDSNLDGLLNNIATQTTVSTKSVNSNNAISQPQYRNVSYDELVDMVKKNGGKLEIKLTPTQFVPANKLENPNPLAYLAKSMEGVIGSVLVKAQLSEMGGSRYNRHYNVEEEKIIDIGGNLLKIKRTKNLCYSDANGNRKDYVVPAVGMFDGDIADYPTIKMDGKLGDLYIYYMATTGTLYKQVGNVGTIFRPVYPRELKEGEKPNFRFPTGAKITLSLEDLYLKEVEKNQGCKLHLTEVIDPNFLKFSK